MNECSLIILDREYIFLCYCTIEFGDIEMKYVYLQETVICMQGIKKKI